MPIAKELRGFYGREWKTVTRPRILLRAENKCEFCGVPNHMRVLRAAGWWTPLVDPQATGEYSPSWALVLEDEPAELFWTPPDGRPGSMLNFHPLIVRVVQIRLTIGHLNHVSGDDRDENLKAMCQWCHLNYDKVHHAETRAIHKDERRPLIVSCPPIEIA